jgi:hypothetical protein
MQRRIQFLIVFSALAFCAGSLQAQGGFALFGGYSFLRPSLTQTETFVCPPGLACPTVVTKPVAVNTTPNLNGWEVSGMYKIFPWLGAMADFSGNYGKALGGSSVDFHTFLLGPEVRWPARVSPFAHVLLGGAHESTSTGSLSGIALYNTVLSSSDTAFAFALGEGVDRKVMPLVSFRLIQVDYLMTRFASTTEGQPRISAGLVLHF